MLVKGAPDIYNSLSESIDASFSRFHTNTLKTVNGLAPGRQYVDG